MYPYLLLFALLFFSCQSPSPLPPAEVERIALKEANIQSSSIFSTDQQGEKIVLRELEYDREGRCIEEKVYLRNTLEYWDSIAYNTQHQITAIQRYFTADSSEVIWRTQHRKDSNTNVVYTREEDGYTIQYFNQHHDLEKLERFRDSSRIETELYEYIKPSKLKSIANYDSLGEPISKTVRVYPSGQQWIEYTLSQGDTIKKIDVQLNENGLYNLVERSFISFTDIENFTYKNNLLTELTSVTTWKYSGSTTTDSLTLYYEYFPRK